MLSTTFHRSFLFIVILITDSSSGTDTLAQALVSLIEEVFVDLVNVLNFYIKCEEEPQRINYFSDLAESTLRGLEDISIRIGMQQELPADSQRHFCLFAVDSLEALKLLFNDVSSQKLNIDGHVLIVLHTFHEYYYDTMKDIFELNWRTGVVDVNVLVEPIPGIILMFTFFPYSIYSCNSVSPVISNRYADSKWKNDVLFPLKLNNMHGCPLICATWEDEPYFKILHDDDGNEIYSGIEGKLLEFIASRMNFTIYLYIMNNEEIDATVDAKGLVFDELFKGGVDLIVGAFHYKPTSKDDFFMPSDSYYSSTINVVIGSRRDQLPPFGKLLFPFSSGVWLYVVICFGVGVLVALSSRRLTQHKRNFILGSMNQIPVYNMFYTALGGGVSKMPTRNFARFLLCVWMLLWLVLRSAYQSALFHFIRTDISLPPPDSIDDALKEDYEILLTPAVYNTLKYLPSIQAASRFLNGTEVENFPMLLDAEKIAILTPYEYFGFFKNQNMGRLSEFHLVTEKVFTQQLSIYLKKNSIFNFEVNAAIWIYACNGLGQKWDQLFIAKSSRKHKVESEGLKRMTIGELRGAIDIYIFGIVISLVVFGMETCIHKLSKYCTREFNKFGQKFKT